MLHTIDQQDMVEHYNCLKRKWMRPKTCILFPFTNVINEQCSVEKRTFQPTFAVEDFVKLQSPGCLVIHSSHNHLHGWKELTNP